MPKSWDHGETVKTAFFGSYMGQNTLQSILSNLQVSDSTLDLPCNHPVHDKLFKVRPFLDMMDKNFKQSYKCGRDLSFDEGCFPFKGKLKFKCYNPSKPNKWHIKIFEVSDAKTGSMVGLDIYTGKNSTECTKIAKSLDPDCNQSTKIVVGLMQKCNLLGKAHHVYLDNYYCSPEPFLELHYLETFACDTVRGGRKNLPKSSDKREIEEER